MSSRIWLTLAFIVAMIWLWRPFLFSEQKPLPTPIADNQPDYIAEQLKQRVFDENGKLSHEVTADSMQLYKATQLTEFTKPVFTIYTDEGIWHLSADSARLVGNDKLILEHQVIASNLTPNALIESISAQSIEYGINTKLMVSNHLVTLSGKGMTVAGQGLNADLNQQIIKLINHTETTYYDQ